MSSARTNSIISILLGQFLSACITVSGACNDYLFRRFNVNLPATGMILFYLLLSSFYLSRWLWQARGKTGSSPSVVFGAALRDKGWWYFGYGLLDCVSALLVVSAYAYTNLATVALLSAVSTPGVIILSRIFLRRKYTLLQYTGATVCIGGVVLFSVSLGLSQQRDAWIGAAFALTSALTYAVANVMAEKLTAGEDYEADEFLGLIGGFGLFWTLVYMVVVGGRTELAGIWSHPLPVYGFILIHVAALFGFYSVLPLFIKRASATMFNLSLLTTNIYSVLVNMLVFRDAFSLFLPVSLLVVTIGILIYSY